MQSNEMCKYMAIIVNMDTTNFSSMIGEIYVEIMCYNVKLYFLNRLKIVFKFHESVNFLCI